MRVMPVLSAVCVGALIAACQTAQPPTSTLPQPSPAEVQADLIGYGRRIAVRHCAECHALEPGQASRLPDAPPFPTLYTRFPVERLGDEMQRGMMVGHPRMPLLRLDEDESAALVAYLASFRPEPLPAGSPS